MAPTMRVSWSFVMQTSSSIVGAYGRLRFSVLARCSASCFVRGAVLLSSMEMSRGIPLLGFTNLILRPLPSLPRVSAIMTVYGA